MKKKITIIKTEADKLDFAAKIVNANIENPIQVETSLYKPKRSLAINRLMWMWYGEIQVFLRDHMGQIYSTDDLHEYFVNLLLPRKIVEIKGKAKDIRAHTSKMTNKEMSQYLETLDHYCGSDLGLSLTHPIDLFNEAMGRK